MNAITVLRDEYAGDDAFLDLVDVLAGTMGQHAFTWFHEKIPALGQRSAADVLENEREGPRVIRSLLLRMPDP